MIKFFKKIRRQFLTEKKTGKYVKYAFGEIVLVVIGILIALQINNGTETSLKNYMKEIELFYLIFNHKLDHKILQKTLIPNYRNEPFLLNALYYKNGLLKFQINNYKQLKKDVQTLLIIVTAEIKQRTQ